MVLESSYPFKNHSFYRKKWKTFAEVFFFKFRVFIVKRCRSFFRISLSRLKSKQTPATLNQNIPGPQDCSVHGAMPLTLFLKERLEVSVGVCVWRRERVCFGKGREGRVKPNRVYTWRHLVMNCMWWREATGKLFPCQQDPATWEPHKHFLTIRIQSLLLLPLEHSGICRCHFLFQKDSASVPVTLGLCVGEQKPPWKSL